MKTIRQVAQATGIEPACVQLPFRRDRSPRGYARVWCHHEELHRNDKKVRLRVYILGKPMQDPWSPERRQRADKAFNTTDWIEVQAYYDAGNSSRETAKHFNIPHCRLDKATKLGLLKRRDNLAARLVAAKRPRKPMSEQARANCSAARCKWNRENPERLRQLMIERARSKNRSVPCERVKAWLRQHGIEFAEEYMPLVHQGRFYSMDIAFPDRKVGVEINGNQHYNKDGSLTPYYQERHNAIEADGWTLHEWHYPLAFKNDELALAFESILSETPIECFDYGAYRPRESPPKYKGPDRRKVSKGPQPHRQHPNRPNRETLQTLIWSKPVAQVAKDLECSWSSIGKWCSEAGIDMPSQGYWARRRAGKSHAQAVLPTPKHEPKPIRRINETVLQRVIELRTQGKKWTVIAREVGFHRHHVKRAYLKWREQRESNPQPPDP